MPEHTENTNGCTDGTNDPVDVALEIALESARDNRVRELIREAQQYRECACCEATDAEVHEAVPHINGGEA